MIQSHGRAIQVSPLVSFFGPRSFLRPWSLTDGNDHHLESLRKTIRSSYLISELSLNQRWSHPPTKLSRALSLQVIAIWLVLTLSLRGMAYFPILDWMTRRQPQNVLRVLLQSWNKRFNPKRARSAWTGFFSQICWLMIIWQTNNQYSILVSCVHSNTPLDSKFCPQSSLQSSPAFPSPVELFTSAFIDVILYFNIICVELENLFSFTSLQVLPLG